MDAGSSNNTAPEPLSGFIIKQNAFCVCFTPIYK